MKADSKVYRFLINLSLIACFGIGQSIASVPRHNDASQDKGVYKNLHEVKVEKEKQITFNNDIEKLSAQEKSHRRPLPLRVSRPMERVMKTSYKPAAKEKKGK